MELKDLVGEHILDGVDFLFGKVEVYDSCFEDAQIMRFRLDGIVYDVAEDPEDGYRSSMREITTSTAPMKNTFTPVKVSCIYKDLDDYGNTSDLLYIYTTDLMNLIILVGTADVDDYYPCFTANFNPLIILPEV